MNVEQRLAKLRHDDVRGLLDFAIAQEAAVLPVREEARLAAGEVIVEIDKQCEERVLADRFAILKRYVTLIALGC